MSESVCYALTLYAMGDPRTNPHLKTATEEHAKHEAEKAGLTPDGECEWRLIDTTDSGRQEWQCRQPALRPETAA